MAASGASRGAKPGVALDSATDADGPGAAHAVDEVGPGRFARMLPALSLALVGVFSLHRLDDFDTWWHLAAGRWIVQHRSIPATDVLSWTVPHNGWTNLQWLYDVLLYGLWSLGGPNLMVLASVACFVVMAALVARHASRFAGPVVVAFLVAWLAATANERFFLRPEMVTFPLLAAVQLVLAEGRTDPRRLRLLVPLMALWANLHSLFIVGIAAIGCAIGGALLALVPLLPAGWRRDSAWEPDARRQLLVWGVAGITATLANPWFGRALLFPLELMTRIDGSSPVYGVIGEFRRPFSDYFPTLALGSYQVMLAAAVLFAGIAAVIRALAGDATEGRGRAARRAQRAGLPGAPKTGCTNGEAAAVMRADVPAASVATPTGPAPGFDLGLFAFALLLGGLSLMARRNVALFAVGAAPFLAACIGVLASRLPASWKRPGSAASRTAAAAVFVAMLVAGGSVVTNAWYARTGETHEFGLGVLEPNFQERAVRFWREQGLPGPLYNDMTAGGYLTWDDPTGGGVYVDGRLEVYDTPFFAAYLQGLGNFAQWSRDADARGIQGVMVFHRWGNRHGFLRALVASGRWSLVYFDETVAIAVRSEGNEARIEAARTAFREQWQQRTVDSLSGPRASFAWQWGIGRYTAQLAYAALLETLGMGQEALRWLEAGIATGLPRDLEVDAHQRAAGQLATLGRWSEARVHLQRALALVPGDPDTTAMLQRLEELSRGG